MVYVLSKLCLLAATLSAITLALPPFVFCLPINVLSSTTSSSSSSSVSRFTHRTSTDQQPSNVNNSSSIIGVILSVSRTNTFHINGGESQQLHNSASVSASDSNINLSKSRILRNVTPSDSNNRKSAILTNNSKIDLLNRSITSGGINSRTSRSLRDRFDTASYHAGGGVGGEYSASADNSDDLTTVDDNSGRNERSTNLSHITGTSRKIQMYVTNRHLQILPDGTVNGTGDDTSIYNAIQKNISVKFVVPNIC